METLGHGHLPAGKARSLRSWLSIALACVAAATGLRLILDPVLVGVPFITFFPAVAVAAYFGGTYAGVIAAVSGGFIASYMWVPPLRQWELTGSAISTVVVYFLLSGLILLLIHRLHNALTRAHEAELQSNLYAREMGHRISNLVALVQAISTMTFKGDGATTEQRSMFNSRLAALSHALTAPPGRDGA